MLTTRPSGLNKATMDGSHTTFLWRTAQRQPHTILQEPATTTPTSRQLSRRRVPHKHVSFATKIPFGSCLSSKERLHEVVSMQTSMSWNDLRHMHPSSTIGMILASKISTDLGPVNFRSASRSASSTDHAIFGSTINDT